MLGYYGETIGPRDPNVIALAVKQSGKPPIQRAARRPAKTEWHELRDAAVAVQGCNGSDEDVLTYAMFPKVAPQFFKTREQGPKNLGKDPAAAQRSGNSRACQASPADSGKGVATTTIT